MPIQKTDNQPETTFIRETVEFFPRRAALVYTLKGKGELSTTPSKPPVQDAQVST